MTDEDAPPRVRELFDRIRGAIGFVVDYTRPGCLLCQQVMDMLWEAQVPFREVDIVHLGAAGQGSPAGGADAEAPERMTWAERMSRLYAATRPR